MILLWFLILPAFWINDDFLNNEKLEFDYEKYELIDAGVKYLNPKHFSVKNFVMYCRFDKKWDCEVDKMFEDLDKFIAENLEEVLVTGGWTDDKVSELEKQLSISFREEIKIFIQKYGVLIGYGVEIAACGRNGYSWFVEDTLRFRKNGLEKKYIVIEGDANWRIVWTMKLVRSSTGD